MAALSLTAGESRVLRSGRQRPTKEEEEGEGEEEEEEERDRCGGR